MNDTIFFKIHPLKTKRIRISSKIISRDKTSPKARNLPKIPTKKNLRSTSLNNMEIMLRHKVIIHNSVVTTHKHTEKILMRIREIKNQTILSKVNYGLTSHKKIRTTTRIKINDFYEVEISWTFSADAFLIFLS